MKSIKLCKQKLIKTFADLILSGELIALIRAHVIAWMRLSIGGNANWYRKSQFQSCDL